MRQLALIIVIISNSLVLRAQPDTAVSTWDSDYCLGKLVEAEIAYRGGDFFGCSRILERALNSCNYRREQKLLALELLAKSYVEINEMDKAEATVKLLLKNFPHYESNEAENPEQFNRLVKKFIIHPQLTIGVKNTGNWPRHKTTKVYSVLDGIDYSQPQAKAPYWFTYYGMAEYEFIDGLSANIDLMFFLSSYRRVIEKDPTFRLTYTEHDGFVEFPVYLKKYFRFGKNFLVYASGGAGVFYMWKARGNATLEYTRGDILTTGMDQDFKGEMKDINLLAMKNRLTGQWNAGIGFGYKLKNLRLFLDARYLGCTGPFTAPEKSDLFPELKNDFFYIDQEMVINQFEVGATISYTLFNSVKRKTVK